MSQHGIPALLSAAHKIIAQANDSDFDAGHMAAIIEDEVGLAEAIAALRRCDKILEQLGVSVNERDFLLKSIARLEGSDVSPPDAVIGTAP